MRPTQAMLWLTGIGAAGLLGWFAAPATGGDAPSGPLARAEAGQVECYSPDFERRTCRAMARYSRNFDGSYDNVAVMKVPHALPATIEVESEVRVVGDAVCGRLRPEDLAAARLVVQGRELPSDAAAPALAEIAGGMRQVIGREVCTRYRPVEQHWVATHTIDGAPDPLGREEQVIWIGDTGDFRVRP